MTSKILLRKKKLEIFFSELSNFYDMGCSRAHKKLRKMLFWEILTNGQRMVRTSTVKYYFCYYTPSVTFDEDDILSFFLRLSSHIGTSRQCAPPPSPAKT